MNSFIYLGTNYLQTSSYFNIPAFAKAPLIIKLISYVFIPGKRFKIFLNSKLVRKPVSFVSVSLQS